MVPFITLGRKISVHLLGVNIITFETTLQMQEISQESYWNRKYKDWKEGGRLLFLIIVISASHF